MQLTINYAPQTDEIYKSLKDLAVMLKKLPGIKTIAIVSFNKRNITMQGKKLIF